MSSMDLQQWLLSQNSYDKGQRPIIKSSSVEREACKISVTSGKGGVGKTSVSIKLGKMLAEMGHRVLLLDCDYNLSNTRVKLGIPVTDNFHSLVTARKDFDDCLYKDGNFHLLSGCNGNLELFDNGIELDKLIIDIIVEHEDRYDFILLDCPAGISKDTLILNAYCNYRFVVVTPDKSSITDSYSLMKILKSKFGISKNHLLANKISSERQYQRMIKVLSETADSFLGVRLNVLGGISLEENAVDLFDKILLKDGESKVHKMFEKLVNKFIEEVSVRSRSVANGWSSGLSDVQVAVDMMSD